MLKFLNDGVQRTVILTNQLRELNLPPFALEGDDATAREAELQHYVAHILTHFKYNGLVAIAMHLSLDRYGFYYPRLAVSTQDRRIADETDRHSVHTVMIDEHYNLSFATASVMAEGVNLDVIEPALGDVVARAMIVVKPEFSDKTWVADIDTTLGDVTHTVQSDTIVYRGDDRRIPIISVESVWQGSGRVNTIGRCTVKGSSDYELDIYPSYIDQLRTLGLIPADGKVRLSMGVNGIMKVGNKPALLETPVTLQVNAIVYPAVDKIDATVYECGAASMKPLAEEYGEASRRLFDVNMPRIIPDFNLHESMFIDTDVHQPWEINGVWTSYIRPVVGCLFDAFPDRHIREQYTIDSAIRITSMLVKVSATVDGEEIVEYHRVDPDIRLYVDRSTPQVELRKFDNVARLGLGCVAADGRTSALIPEQGAFGNINATVSINLVDGGFYARFGKGTVYNSDVDATINAEVVGWYPDGYYVRKDKVTRLSNANVPANLQDLAYGVYVGGLNEGVSPRHRETLMSSVSTALADSDAVVAFFRALATQENERQKAAQERAAAAGGEERVDVMLKVNGAS